MIIPNSLLVLASVALSPLALARPNALTMFKRQTDAGAIPSQCTFTCQPVQEALASCLVATCLCNSDVLAAFVDCSECTLHATNPTNLNESIASYQASIDAYRQTCASSPTPVALPNVTITSPPANVTYATASSNATSSTISNSSVSASASASATSSVSSRASSVSASRTSATAGQTSSTGVGAGASASASPSGTSGGERNVVLAGGVGAVVMAMMGLAVFI